MCALRGAEVKAMKRFGIEYDVDYGADHRSGWAIHYDGINLVSFERWLVVAVSKALWKLAVVR